MRNDKHFIEEFSIERVVKTTIQIWYDKGLFDKYDNANEVLNDYLEESKRVSRIFFINVFLKNKPTANIKSHQVRSSYGLD